MMAYVWDCLYIYMSVSLCVYTDIPHFIAFYFTVLHRYCIFNKLKICGSCALNKLSNTFPTTFAHFMSLSHLGNSCNIPNFFIIVKIAMVIWDQRSVTDLDSLKAHMTVFLVIKYCLIKESSLCFLRHTLHT